MRSSRAVKSNKPTLRHEDNLKKQNKIVQPSPVRPHQEHRTLIISSYHQINLPKQKQHLHHHGVPTHGRSLLLPTQKIMSLHLINHRQHRLRNSRQHWTSTQSRHRIPVTQTLKPTSYRRRSY
jgi:hypothetical protein